MIESFNRQKPSGEKYGCDATTQTGAKSFITKQLHYRLLHFLITLRQNELASYCFKLKLPQLIRI